MCRALPFRPAQKLSCSDIPFATAQRLLGWMTREVGVISTTQVRRWVQQHGKLIRQAEQAEVQALLEAYRPQAKDTDSLETLITYLSDRRAYLPNYKARRAQRQYIGSAHAEKANDLLVARRQKHQWMHWREASSDGLAALRTLLLGGWDLYWKEQQVLPLAVPKPT